MAAQLLPGRPGNLTVDQEVKLQDLWKATLKVFGVPLGEVPGMSDTINGTLDGEGEGEGEEEEEDDPKADTKGGEKDKKKKKRNIFGRKKKDKEDKDPKPEKKTAEKMPTAADDKYGQTKEYLDALEKNAPEDLRDAFWKMAKSDHPDALLLRFLRARKWDIEKALVMMISTMNWRLNEMNVDDDIMANGEATMVEKSKSSEPATKKVGDDFLAQLRLGKSFLHGVDKEGRPMCIVRVRLHKQGEQSEASLERFTVYTIETARLMLKPPVDTAAIVFDMTGFSMANMDYGPVKFMIKCFEANYPESLGVVLVHKAPWIFQGIWKIIRGWLDPVVAGKVHFTNSIGDLETYIARDHIPTELGGDEKWAYKYPEPGPDEDAAMADTATKARLLKARDALVNEYEAATRDWIKGPPGEAAVKAQRTELAEQLKNNYWDLDPYVRARSLYDRSGIIGAGGVLTHYPGATHPPAGGAAPASGTAASEPAATVPSKPASLAGGAAPAGGKPDGDPAEKAPSKPASLAGAKPESEPAETVPSKPASQAGPIPAGHEEDAVD